ncbi:restriction endonuclease subunit S [Zoogloea sp.]|uniref:restriction endonuclease subunit S n=1 Tax=Zoogloea sp. TaxID=49181 RepID=UPI0035ADD28B
MNAWPIACLADIADITMGQSPPGETYNERGNGLPFFQGKSEFGETYPIPRKWCSEPKKVAEPGDILISVRAPVGPSNLADTRCCIGRGLASVRAKTDFLDVQYLRYCIRHAEPTLASLGQGSTFAAIGRTELASTKVPVPPLPEQRRIVDILSRAEGIVRLRREAEKKAAELIPALFIEMFGDPAANPKGLPLVPLGALLEDGPQNGLYKHSSHYGEGTPILRIDAFYDGRVRDMASLKRVRVSEDERHKFRLNSRDIVINRVNSVEYLGKSAIIPLLVEPTVFESNMMRMTLNEGRVFPEFLIELLQTAYAKRHFLANAKHAINQSSINQQDVKTIAVPLPPIDLQRQFAQRVEAIRALQAQQAAATAKAQASFDALLAQAFPA